MNALKNVFLLLLFLEITINESSSDLSVIECQNLTDMIVSCKLCSDKGECLVFLIIILLLMSINPLMLK